MTILPIYPMLKTMSDTLIADTIEQPEIMAFLPDELLDFLMTHTWRDGVNDQAVEVKYAARGGSGA